MPRACLPNVNNLKPVLDFLWQVLDVLSVLSRQKDRLDACPKGPNQLLLDTPDGSHSAAEGYLALPHVLATMVGYFVHWQNRANSQRDGWGQVTVMAMVGGTGLPEKREIRAMAWPMPLLGPSLGMAPDGQWTWMLRFFMISVAGSGASPSSNACALTHDRATSTLSLSTSPSLPVSCTLPLPGMSATSMKRMLPLPPELYATRPVTIPGRLVFSAISSSNFSMPKMFSTSSTVSFGRYSPRRPPSLASANSTALARQTDPSSRSRLRTPDSRVYDSMILDTTSWLKATWSSASPLTRICFGIRCCIAMWRFSSVV
ncbi:hypothetical protein G6O67_000702 [Ophiocordyceps sinensis]|uniref:Uncharacterized protein n=1 Tax=Ophiocordyceps sinensis TaxID=72228 RepID=A0A8H4PZJ6_9HYPO|nr:hypothetical protein G6O67_000702 [Ophiocordyceps sinensis]